MVHWKCVRREDFCWPVCSDHGQRKHKPRVLLLLLIVPKSDCMREEGKPFEHEVDIIAWEWTTVNKKIIIRDLVEFDSWSNFFFFVICVQE